MEGLHNLIGQCAGLISLGAYGLYCYTTVHGKTRPNRATWWILTFIGGIIVLSYYAVGARETMWLPLSYFFGPLAISILSIKYGEGGWNLVDRVCILGAITGAIFWLVFNSPLIALIANLAMDLFGLAPTIKKSYLRPEGEDRYAWSLESFASVINVFAVEQWKFAILVHPVYLVVINLLITALLFRPTGKKKT